tara:strand:+ start:1389 stop:1658 length:270 start_codon:yes stop_codon:yes gene_type:complete
MELNNNFDGLKMFQSFVTDCRKELDENYNDYLNFNRKNNITDGVTYMEFCMLEFIKHSFRMFKKFFDEEGHPDWTSVALSPQSDDELPN